MVGKTYRLPTKEEALETIEEFCKELREIISVVLERFLEDNEKVYFSRGFDSTWRIPQIYGNPKVHKSNITTI